MSEVESACSRPNATRRRSSAGSDETGCPIAVRRPAICRSTTRARDQAGRQHQAHDRQPRAEAHRSRADQLHGHERRGQDDARAVAHDVELPQHLAHDAGGLRASGARVGRLFQSAEHGRRDDAADCDHPAQPDHQGQDVDVPQRDHTGIIVRFATPPVRSACTPSPMSSPASSTAPPVAPVEWLEWSLAAFARAREEGKPILLSISAQLVPRLWRDGSCLRTPIPQWRR